MTCKKTAEIGRTAGREHHLVTGGGGYAGWRLGLRLLKKGHRVTLFDIQRPTEEIPDDVTFVKGDITDYEQVEDAFTSVDCIYHLASYGMSGREQLNKNLIELVNIKGTENVIKACKHHGIDRLVYTSTYNVVFGGQEIKNGDERLPYLPLEEHPDHYSRTKSLAEMRVLKANGEALATGRYMRTCALRLAGVYGPGEQRHLPRIVTYIERGLFSFTYGATDSKVEFLHVDNLVEAHIKAAEALSDGRGAVAAGQAYFISDCKPVNNFEFFRPLVEGLGYRFPTVRLPLIVIYFIAFITEYVHSVVGRVYNFQPLLTRTEVYKTGVTHYFNISKARRDLQYKPSVQNDLTQVVTWFRERGHGRQKAPPSTVTRLLVDLALAAMFVIVVMSFLPGTT